MPEFDPTKFSSNIEQNPLRKYFRQPKVYITLPSKGVFYPADAINIPEGNEFPVFATVSYTHLTLPTICSV